MSRRNELTVCCCKTWFRRLEDKESVRSDRRFGSYILLQVACGFILLQSFKYIFHCSDLDSLLQYLNSLVFGALHFNTSNNFFKCILKSEHAEPTQSLQPLGLIFFSNEQRRQLYVASHYGQRSARHASLHTDFLKDNVHFHLKRTACMIDENKVPKDLLDAVKKKHISIQHLPKDMINESLYIEFYMPKSKCKLDTSYLVQCEVVLRRKDNVILCDDTFTYTISAVVHPTPSSR
jgi:hypothetical protein